jgi:hypothetical protein
MKLAAIAWHYYLRTLGMKVLVHACILWVRRPDLLQQAAAGYLYLMII